MLPELTFDAETHTYRVGGRLVPSVTQVLDPLLELWRIDPVVLKAAAEFGTNVHTAVDLYNREILDWEQLDPALYPYVTGWRRFIESTGTVILESEFRVYHPGIGYAGTGDNVGLMPGRKSRGEVRTLIDVKSGIVPFTVGPQTAAYEEARRAMGRPPCRRRLCVQLKAEEPFYAVTELTELHDFSMFLSALNVYRFKEKHNVRS